MTKRHTIGQIYAMSLLSSGTGSVSTTGTGISNRKTMKVRATASRKTLFVLIVALSTHIGAAQQTTAVPGSLDAATTVDGRYLPAPLAWQQQAGAVVLQDPANAYQWELCDVSKDWTQNNNVAAANPEKLKEMQQQLWMELARHQALPLDASVVTRVVTPRPSVTAGRTVFTYSGETVTGIPPGAAPSLLNTSYTITAEVGIPQGGAEAMIHTNGGRFGG